jgi:Sulfatase
LIENNLDWFWGDYLFFTWIILWVQILPFVFLFVMDRVILKLATGTTWLQVWNAFLFTLLALSLFRQFQILHSSSYAQLFGFLPLSIPYLLLSAIIFWISFKSKRILPSYLSILGLLSILLTASFIHRSGLLTSTWNKPNISFNLSENTGRTPVFFVVFDELSYAALLNKEGGLNREAFPNFAKLADGGAWFTNATTNHWGTLKAIPTLLTGRASTDPETVSLFESLRGKYRINMITTEMGVERWMRTGKISRQVDHYDGKAYLLRSNPIYCARYIFRLFLDSDFFSLTHPANQVNFSSAYHLTFPLELRSYLQTIDARKAAGQISFWHLSLPHSPFLYSVDGKLQNKHNMNFPFPELYDPAEFDKTWSHYIEQVRYSDRILGLVLDRMKQQNLYDSSFLIVTSDHGLRVWGDIYSYVDLIAHVPLVIHGPGIQRATYDWDVQQIDVVPTLLDLLQQPFQSNSYDGVSVFATSRPDRTKTLYMDGGSAPGEVYAYDAHAGTWKRSGSQESTAGTSGLITSMGATGSSMKAGSSFSAVMVINDLMASQDKRQDFLTIYLRKDFPKNVSDSQIESLLGSIQDLEKLPDQASINFKKGMYYFFVALSETQRIASGKNQDPAIVDRHWKLALESFKKSGQLEAGMVKEITKILEQADANADQSLSSEELHSILLHRLPAVS